MAAEGVAEERRRRKRDMCARLVFVAVAAGRPVRSARPLPAARAQFQAPPTRSNTRTPARSKRFRTISCKFRDSKNDEWILQTRRRNQDHASTARPSATALRPGLLRASSPARSTRRGRCEETVEEIEIISRRGQVSLGLFAAERRTTCRQDRPQLRPSATYRHQGQARHASRRPVLAVWPAAGRSPGKTGRRVEGEAQPRRPELAQAGDDGEGEGLVLRKVATRGRLQPGRAGRWPRRSRSRWPSRWPTPARKRKPAEKPSKSTAKSQPRLEIVARSWQASRAALQMPICASASMMLPRFASQLGVRRFVLVAPRRIVARRSSDGSRG